MAKIVFKHISFRPATLDRIDQCNDIIDKYMSMGLRLTLRQLYYQFVAAAIIPNEEKAYKNLGSILADGRMAGLIDWDSIEDRNREPIRAAEFDDLDELVEAALDSYRLPRWEGQQVYAELWVEKAALAGVLEPLAREYHAVLMVNRGYSSVSAMYESAQRIITNQAKAGAAFSIIFYLGDLDPSGEDMVRDIQDRLDIFGANVEVRKVALTMKQVNKFKPPPNPTKLTDSRAAGFVAKYGYESWEVDALPPPELARIIKVAFDSVVNRTAMDAVVDKEEVDKVRLKDALEAM